MPGGIVNPVPVYTQETFAKAVLPSIGVPASQAAVNLFVAWERAEGGHWKNSAKYNPLNTTLERGASKSAGLKNPNVQAYANWSDGIHATIDTLNESRYSGIRAALNAKDKDAFVNAVVSSPWGTPREPLASIVADTTLGEYSAGALVKNVTGITNPVTAVVDKVLAFEKKAGITIGAFLLGMLLIVLGIVVLALSNKNVRTAVGAAAPLPGGKLKLLSKASAGSRALTPETISARETAKTAAMADRARILGEIRKANAAKPKAKPEPMHPSNPAHPLHALYLRGRVREAGGVKPKMGHAEIVERLQAGAAKVASE